MKTTRTQTTIRIAVALALSLTLGACASISQRAMANGRSMSMYSDRAYNAVSNGNMSVEAARALRLSYDPLPWKAQSRAYPAFGYWWY
jgi:hypothetical protein